WKHTLHPHLSLIYSTKMTKHDKEENVKNIQYPKLLTFDRLMINNNEKIIAEKEEQDILAWKPEYEIILSG
ncbi:hypothetical protein ACFL1A_03375, partial [Patescibacteria group bacterium]